MSNESLLAGFEFVPSDGVPFITLDKERRFYINSSARKLIGVKPYSKLIVAYKPDEKALAIIRTADGLRANDEAGFAVYVVDKRFYMSARKFANMYAYAVEEAPYEFVYDRGSSDGNVFIFRLKTQ